MHAKRFLSLAGICEWTASSNAFWYSISSSSNPRATHAARKESWDPHGAGRGGLTIIIQNCDWHRPALHAARLELGLSRAAAIVSSFRSLAAWLTAIPSRKDPERQRRRLPWLPAPNFLMFALVGLPVRKVSQEAAPAASRRLAGRLDL